MEKPLLLTYREDTNKNDDGFVSPKRPSDNSSNDPPSFTDPGESLCLVPFRWWEEAECGGEVGKGDLYKVGVDDVVVSEDLMNVDGFEETLSKEISVYLRKSVEEEEVCGGDDLALVSEWMFLSVFKWHYAKKWGNLAEGKTAHDLFSLSIRVLYGAETNTLVVKICGKDNEIGAFNCASKIFCSNSGMLQIWDFSGQTNQLFLDDMKQFKGSDQSNEIVMWLQIYDLSCPVKEKEGGKEEMVVEQSMVDDPTSSSPSIANGCMDKVNSRSASDRGYSRIFLLGLTGLNNLGNTCFMNSAIQCLVHTPKLADYFLGNFRRDLNFENPLGKNGKLAIVFGHLLRNLWVSKAASIRPNLFKSTIFNIATQFGGYCQHDSQEFLAFLLDGLHEDLNRVKSKPYVQAKEEDGRPHEEVADEYWGNHLSRNDSIIVDLCQGQYRSTVSCPDCRKSSVTFEPFMYLSLPIPSTTLRKMTLTVLSHGAATLDQVTVTVPKKGTIENLQEVVAEACSLREDETLRIAEICNHEIYRFFDNPCDLVEKIQDSDCLIVYKLPKDDSGSPWVVFVHEFMPEHMEYFPPYGYPRDIHGFPMDRRVTRNQWRNRESLCPPSGCPEDNGWPAMVAVMHHQGRSHGCCPPYGCPEDNGRPTMDTVMHHQGRSPMSCELPEDDMHHQKRKSRCPPIGYPEDDMGTSMGMYMNTQHQMMRNPIRSYFKPQNRKIGIPLLTRISDFSKGSEIREAFLKLIDPFLLPNEKSSQDNIVETANITVSGKEDAEMENQFLLPNEKSSQDNVVETANITVSGKEDAEMENQFLLLNEKSSQDNVVETANITVSGKESEMENQFLLPNEKSSQDNIVETANITVSGKEDAEMENQFLLPNERSPQDNIVETANITVSGKDYAEMENQSEEGLDDTDDDFEFALERSWRKCNIEMDKPVPITNEGDVPNKVIVNWPQNMIEECDTLLLRKLPVVFKSTSFMEDSVSLYKCMEAFLTEEPLGPEDMWYCPNCKVHKQANKKLDLWRLPEILVIHLKRFSYRTYFLNKLETPVDFPIDNFDISDYLIHKNEMVSCHYALYAVTNHYGGTGSGHYTAFVKQNEDRWYEFDDSGVAPVAEEEQIKTPAAYVLFYKRV